MDPDCPICLGSLRRPVFAPCPGRHAFCRECLRGVLELFCPVCRNSSDEVALFIFKRSQPRQNLAAWHMAHFASSAKLGKPRIVRALLQARCCIDAALDDDQRAPLHVASEADQEEVVRVLLQSRASINKKDAFGFTPLHAAAEANSLGVVNCLLESRAFKNALQNTGKTPLFIASAAGQLGAVQRLLSHRADPHKLSRKESLLHAAAECFTGLPVVQYLVDEVGLNLDVQDSRGETPLHKSCTSGSLEIVQSLLRSRANVNKKSRIGQVPIHISASHGDIQILEALCASRADVHHVDFHGRSPLTEASIHGSLDAVRYLIGITLPASLANDAAVAGAAYWGFEEIVTELLSARASPDKMHSGETPLFVAACEGHMQIVSHLIAARANVDQPVPAQRHAPNTALTVAANHGHVGMIQLLIERRACANLASRRDSRLGDSPLHFAAKAGQAAAIDALLAGGAKKDTTNRCGETALHLSAGYNSVPATRALLQAGVAVDKCSRVGLTALHYAAMSSHVEVASALIQGRASVNKASLSARGWWSGSAFFNLTANRYYKATALMLAVDCAGISRAKPLSVVRALMLSRAAVNKANSEGTTPLMAAVRHENVAMARALISGGASVHATDAEGQTAEDIACQKARLCSLWKRSRIKGLVTSAKRMTEMVQLLKRQSSSSEISAPKRARR